jgi:hypothetical protein
LTLSNLTIDLLRDLQKTIGKANEAKGFHDDRPKPMRIGASVESQMDRAARLSQWQGNKLMLIVSEIVEAHDEIRSGKPADETYYPTLSEGEEDGHLTRHKPEGVPSEIADAVIRCFDFAHTEGFDLAAIINEKLTYNSTRPRLHGKAF